MTVDAVALGAQPSEVTSPGRSPLEWRAFAGRAVRRFVRTPETLISTVVFPLLLLLVLLAVFSTAVEAFDDGSYVQRLVPALVVSGLMFGSIGTAAGFYADLHGGFMQRVRSLPVAPAGPLVGTVVAEVARALVAVAVLVGVGSAFGFRFEAGIGPAVGFVAVAALAGMSLVWIGLALATVARSPESLTPPLSALFLVLLFLSRGLVPLEAYPGWVQPVVQANPASAFVLALDRLARGGELVGPILVAVAWAVGITIALGTVAVRAAHRHTSP